MDKLGAKKGRLVRSAETVKLGAFAAATAADYDDPAPSEPDAAHHGHGAAAVHRIVVEGRQNCTHLP